MFEEEKKWNWINAFENQISMNLDWGDEDDEVVADGEFKSDVDDPENADTDGANDAEQHDEVANSPVVGTPESKAREGR